MSDITDFIALDSTRYILEKCKQDSGPPFQICPPRITPIHMLPIRPIASFLTILLDTSQGQSCLFHILSLRPSNIAQRQIENEKGYICELSARPNSLWSRAMMSQTPSL